MGSNEEMDPKILEEIEKLVITKSMDIEDCEPPCEKTNKHDDPEPEAVEKVVWHIKEDDEDDEDNSSVVETKDETDDLNKDENVTD